MFRAILSLSLIFSGIATAADALECSSLESRIETTALALSEPIARNLLTDNPGSFGETGQLNPIVFSIQPNDGAKIGWIDQHGLTHVTPLDSNLKRSGKDLIAPGTLRDLVAHNEGSAVLSIGNGMVLSRFDDQKGQVFSRSIIGYSVSRMHMGSLAYNGKHYAAYFGISKDFGKGGIHQGEAFVRVTPEGNPQTINDWGCSHSIDLRYVFGEKGGHKFCLSDAFPSMGFRFNDAHFFSVSGDMGGGTSGRIGGVAVAKGHLAFAYTAYGVGHLTISEEATGKLIISGQLPNKANPDYNLKLAKYGEDAFLVSWYNSAEKKRPAAVWGIDGKRKDGISDLGVGAYPRGDFKTFSNGDIGWVTSTENPKILNIHRLKYCQNNG